MAAKVSTPRHETNGGNSRIGHSLLHKLAPTKFVRCIVEMLDDSHTEVDIESRSSGGVLFKKIINELNLAEPDYFGLQFCRGSSSKPEWLEHDKVIKRQLKGLVQPYKFCFAVRFFPTEPSRVAEDLTRYHMFLNIKKDLKNGRLSCPKETAAELSSLIVQSEAGDYPNNQPDQYISDYQLVPNQTPEFEERVFHYHKENVGLSPAQAELKFLEIAKRLELYGSEVQKAKDAEGYDIEVIVCSEGIKIYRDNKRLNIFAWSRIEKVLFNRKHFYVQLLPDVDRDPESKTIVGFILPSIKSCKALWKSAVAHHTFYRKDYRDRFRERPKLIRFGSTYKYRGRTQFQAVEATRRSFRKETSFQRTSSSRHSERSSGKFGESSLSGSTRLHCDTDSDVTSMSTTRG
ncbi:Tyrosine- phosphatase non-receptor type 4, partial [Paramuricea clavata]